MEKTLITTSTRGQAGFRRRGVPDAQHLRALLAAAIVDLMGRSDLPLHQAAEKAGLKIAEAKRLQTMKLGKFSIEKLMAVLAALQVTVDFDVTIAPRTSLRHLN